MAKGMQKMNGEMIHFNKPPFAGKELEYIAETIQNFKISGDGKFTKLCSEWIEKKTGIQKVMLTTSCTHALEMAAILLDLHEGDEVIMPSFTFVSTANAFVIRGAKIVFVDIRPDTMNIDENLIEAAISPRTKAIVPVHYAGIACEMDKICDIAKKYGLFVIEDAAQGMMATYKNQALGSIGDFGCYSFHDTKNYSMGEGGAFLIRDSHFIERAEIIREKGTNRTKFWRGEVDKYSWIGIGSSYLPSELNVAYLWAQLEQADRINESRRTNWNKYYGGLQLLEECGKIQLPKVPEGCVHNGHMFYIKCKDTKQRASLINFLKRNNISSVFHYIPLHTAMAGQKYGRFCGKEEFTTVESQRLLRLPMFYGLQINEVDYIIKKISEFYNENY